MGTERFNIKEQVVKNLSNRLEELKLEEQKRLNTLANKTFEKIGTMTIVKDFRINVRYDTLEVGEENFDSSREYDVDILSDVIKLKDGISEEHSEEIIVDFKHNIKSIDEDSQEGIALKDQIQDQINTFNNKNRDIIEEYEKEFLKIYKVYVRILEIHKKVIRQATTKGTEDDLKTEYIGRYNYYKLKVLKSIGDIFDIKVNSAKDIQDLKDAATRAKYEGKQRYTRDFRKVWALYKLLLGDFTKFKKKVQEKIQEVTEEVTEELIERKIKELIKYPNLDFNFKDIKAEVEANKNYIDHRVYNEFYIKWFEGTEYTLPILETSTKVPSAVETKGN